jgi:hypothetical protein
MRSLIVPRVGSEREDDAEHDGDRFDDECFCVTRDVH